MKKLLALMIVSSVALAQNPQSIQFPKGIKTDSVFSLNAARILFRVEAGRDVLRLFDDSVSFYAGNVHAGFLTTTGLSLIHSTKPTARLNLPASDSVGNIPPLRFTDGKLTDTPQTLALETDGDSLYFTPNDGVRRALALAAIDTTGGGGLAGGWRRTDKIYTDTAGVKVHVRAAEGDTTETKLFNVYGTSDFGNDVTFDADLYFKSTKIFEDSDTSLVNLSYKGASISTTYTDAKITSITGSLGVIALPTTGATKIRLDKLNIDSVGTIIKGVWTGSSIGTGYTDAKITSIVGSLGVIALPTTGDTKIRLNKTAIDTVGTLAAGSIPISLITGQGSMAYVDSTKYHGSASITTVGTITSGIWNAGAVTSSGTVKGTQLEVNGSTFSEVLQLVNGSDATLFTFTAGNWDLTFPGKNGTLAITTDKPATAVYSDSTARADWAKVTNKPYTFASMSAVDSTKYHGSASINTVGTLSAGSVPMSLVTGEGSMAYVDSTTYHGSSSITEVGALGTVTIGSSGYVAFQGTGGYIYLQASLATLNPFITLPNQTGTIALTSDINTSDWNTAYSDRMKWDGGSTGLVAATGRTSLGLGTAAQSATTDFMPAGYPGSGIVTSTGSAWGTSIADASANWNTAYTDRMKWDGGSTGLVAATGRTSLGLGDMATGSYPSSGTVVSTGSGWSTSVTGLTSTRSWLDADGYSHDVTISNGIITAWVKEK